MIIRTEAIVLRNIDYGETSQIVTLFTRQKGKLSVMAKGSRRSRSRFGSTLQPMSYAQVVFYYKSSRGVQTLTESSHVRSMHGIARNLENLSLGLRTVEFVNALMQDEQQNPVVFNLVVEVLDRLSRHPVNSENLIYYFQLRFASILGFAPDIEREMLDNLPPEGGILSLESGAVGNTLADIGTARQASRAALRAFGICARADLETVMRMRLDRRTGAEVSVLIEEFLRYHVEDAYPTRSTRVVGQLFNAPRRS